jgi:hypothetical protein
MNNLQQQINDLRTNLAESIRKSIITQIPDLSSISNSNYQTYPNSYPFVQAQTQTYPNYQSSQIYFSKPFVNIQKPINTFDFSYQIPSRPTYSTPTYPPRTNNYGSGNLFGQFSSNNQYNPFNQMSNSYGK